MGIKYDELSEEEKLQWRSRKSWLNVMKFYLQIKSFLFNEDTAEKMFAQLMSTGHTGGIHVEGGDVIGKTIIFAANNDNAGFYKSALIKIIPDGLGKWRK